MSSKEFKQTVKTVSRNFERYTEAMETDIQILISSMLDVIESKIVALRKLLKLKLCIKNIKSCAGLDCITQIDENSTFTIEDANSLKPRETGSLEELSSMIYEIDKNSLPASDYNKQSEKVQERLRHLEDYVDIESLCSALNHHHKNLSVAQEITEENREALNKYIYLLLDAQRNKEERKKENSKIGDCTLEHHNDTKISIGKDDYNSIVNILNMVIQSYKMQEEILTRNHTVDKRRTDPALVKPSIAERKNVSDSLCQPRDNGPEKKKSRTKRSGNCFNL